MTTTRAVRRAARSPAAEADIARLCVFTFFFAMSIIAGLSLFAYIWFKRDKHGPSVTVVQYAE